MDTTDSDFGAFTVAFPAAVEADFRGAYGDAHWAKIKHALALPTRATAVRINTLRTTREAALAALAEALGPFNARLTADSGRPPIVPIAHPQLPDVVMLPSAPPLTGPDAVAYRPDWRSVVVDRLCGEAVLRGSDIFCRGVMSASSGLNAGDRVNVFVDLEHRSTRGSDVLEHVGRKLLIAHGTMTMARAELFRSTRGLAVTGLRRVCHDAPPMNGLLPQTIYTQNLPSTVVAHNLAPVPGDVVLDMCAAPGGKTSHVATLMRNDGILVCCDKSKRKALELQGLFGPAQLDLDMVTALRLDSMRAVLPKGAPHVSVAEILTRAKAQQHEQRLPLPKVEGFCPETFDRILLDPPCSALGLRPRLAHDSDATELAIFTSMQRNFLWCAALLLKVGGTLMYSTCTINPRENERMVRYALDHFPLELVRQEVHIGATGLPNQGLSEAEAALVQRFDPADHALDTMGFFCAKFIKTRSIREGEDQVAAPTTAEAIGDE